MEENRILDINRDDIKALEATQIAGPLSYLADLQGIECYCEETGE